MTPLEIIALANAIAALAAKILPALQNLQQSTELTEAQRKDLDEKIDAMHTLACMQVEPDPE
jgi:phage shock protein A